MPEEPENMHPDIDTHWGTITPATDAARRDPALHALASLRAAISLLQRGGKKAAASDKMFAQMLVDYTNAADTFAAALTEAASQPREGGCSPLHWRSRIGDSAARLHRIEIGERLSAVYDGKTEEKRAYQVRADLGVLLAGCNVFAALTQRPPEQAGNSVAIAKARLSIATVKARNSGQPKVEVVADDVAVLLAAHSDCDRRLSPEQAGADAEALAGYRAAVSFISADAWDGCSDCIEVLKAARVADWQNSQAADPDATARELARIRKHRNDCADRSPEQAGAGEALTWLTDRDNLILFNGIQPDGWWEVRRGNVKGEVRGRGPTPLAALIAAMPATFSAAPTPPDAGPGEIPAGMVEQIVERLEAAFRGAGFIDSFRENGHQQTEERDACEGLEEIAREIAALTPKAPPQTPPDALMGEMLTPEDAWQELVEFTDRTSPEEYPDMCLITRDELIDFMRRTLPTPPDAGIGSDGAGERV